MYMFAKENIFLLETFMLAKLTNLALKASWSVHGVGLVGSCAGQVPLIGGMKQRAVTPRYWLQAIRHS